MVVNLDPFHMQHGFVELPLGDWGLDAVATSSRSTICCRTSATSGAAPRNYVRLDPGSRVAHILLVQLAAPLPPEPALED